MTDCLWLTVIGPHLLSALASHGRWTKVIALVRPPIERDPAIGLGLPLEFEFEILSADFSQPGLGLSDADRRMITSTVFDCVVHSAAYVDHVRTYQQMKAANVASCDELVELVAHSRLRFVFVSSVSAACRGAAESIDSTPESEVTALGKFTSNLSLLVIHGYVPDRLVVFAGGGYGQSKWVAERRLAAACTHGLLRSLCVVRLGLIGPHSQTAEANVTDWIQLFLKAAIAVQAIPTMSADSDIEMLPVDATAQVLTALAVNDAVGTGIEVVHLDARAANMHPCPLLPLFSAVGGDTWPRLPYSEWHARVRAHGGVSAQPLSFLIIACDVRLPF